MKTYKCIICKAEGASRKEAVHIVGLSHCETMSMRKPVVVFPEPVWSYATDRIFR